MALIAIHSVPTLQDRLQFFRTCPADDISALCEAIQDLNDKLPQSYLATLKDTERIICLRASLICWSITQGQQVPREMQLRAVLAHRLGKDSLIYAGTGSGKTLSIALCILLDDPSENKVTITISPLKRLQISQENDFRKRYGIPTLIINEDTPGDSEWWKENMFDSRYPDRIPTRHLIVTVEQLFRTKSGHMTRIGRMIREPPFGQHVGRVNVDEAHFAYTAGVALNGLAAFRDAWESLPELKIILAQSIKWHLFSATFPPHILSFVKAKLLKPNFEFIRKTSNRKNIIYATHEVPGKVDDPKNCECFILEPFDMEYQPHVIIFVDNKDHAAKITNYLDGILPSEWQGKGVVRHYHSKMSQLYMQQTHDEFILPTGTCRVLVATSAESTGIDFPNVKIVATLGLPQTIVDALQRGGRAIRIGNETAIFVVFYESWANEIEEDEFMDGTDPDCPRTELHKNSRVQARVALSGIRLAKCQTCLRAFYADYLDDHEEDALIFTGQFCCDRHNKGFELQKFLPGLLYDGATNQAAEETMSERVAIRPKAQRIELEKKIMAWLDIQVEKDPGNCPAYEILSIEQTKTLLRMSSKEVTSADAIVTAIDENEEWAQRWSRDLFKIIFEFDLEQAATKASSKAQKRTAQEALQGGNTGFQFTFVNLTTESFENIGSSSGPSKKKRS